MRVGYLMSHYPAVSHAFVLREVQAVRALGVAVDTLSIHAPDGDALLADADREAARTTFNVLPRSLPSLASAHWGALRRSPRGYVETFLLALGTSPPGLRARLWRLFYFAEAMVVAQHCRSAAITHLHAQFADSATDVAMLVAHYEGVTHPRAGTLTWSLAVHGSVEFYNVTLFNLPLKLRRADFAVAISDFGRSQLMGLTDESSWAHIHVVHCGVDPEVYVPPVGRVRTGEPLTILYVGRLVGVKGSSLLLESFAALVSEGHDLALTIVGEGPAKAGLKRRIAALGLGDRTRLLGAVGQDRIREIYAGADIFCLPSFAEGVPVVAMEAMAMELPVVVTRIMGIPELVTDGVDGLLVAPGRTDELTDALRRLVLEPGLRARLGRAGRERVIHDYDVRESARRMRRILETELSHAGPAVAPAAALQRP